MTSLMILVYLANVSNAFSGSLVLIAVTHFTIILAKSLPMKHNSEFDMNYFKKTYISAFIIIIASIIPNKETIYIIAGINASNSAIESIQESEIGKKLKIILNHELDEAIKSFEQTQSK